MKKNFDFESAATKFNESVDYFCCDYGNPYIDCGINLICSYRDLKDIDEGWANATIGKTLKRMPKWMAEEILHQYRDIESHFDKDPKGYLATTIIYDELWCKTHPKK